MLGQNGSVADAWPEYSRMKKNSNFFPKPRGSSKFPSSLVCSNPRSVRLSGDLYAFGEKCPLRSHLLTPFSYYCIQKKLEGLQVWQAIKRKILKISESVSENLFKLGWV